MKNIFIYLLAFLVLANCYDVYDISINEEYKIDLNKYKDHIIPSETSFYFRLKLENVDKLDAQLKVFHGSLAGFKVSVCGYLLKPTDDELVNGRCDNIIQSKIVQDNIFDIYSYPFGILEDIQYISIHVYSLYALDNLSLCINASKSEIKYTSYDIDYMKEFVLKGTDFKDQEAALLFVLKKDEGKIESIKLKLRNEISSEIMISVAGFKEKPNAFEDLENPISFYEPKQKSVTNEEEYSIYEYEYEDIKDAEYIAILIFIEERIDYLSIIVGL